MGTGIGIVASATAKLDVKFVDNPTSLKKSKEFIEGWVKKEIGKGKIKEDEG